jgi:hypothetical protein
MYMYEDCSESSQNSSVLTLFLDFQLSYTYPSSKFPGGVVQHSVSFFTFWSTAWRILVELLSLCYIHNDVLYHLKSSSCLGHFYIKSHKGIGQANGDVVEGQETNVLPRALRLTSLSELAHCYDGGATFWQSTSCVIFFVTHISHPLNASELPDNKHDHLSGPVEWNEWMNFMETWCIPKFCVQIV